MADYGLEADLFKAVPELTEKISKIKSGWLFVDGQMNFKFYDNIIMVLFANKGREKYKNFLFLQIGCTTFFYSKTLTKSKVLLKWQKIRDNGSWKWYD